MQHINIYIYMFLSYSTFSAFEIPMHYIYNILYYIYECVPWSHFHIHIHTCMIIIMRQPTTISSFTCISGKRAPIHSNAHRNGPKISCGIQLSFHSFTSTHTHTHILSDRRRNAHSRIIFWLDCRFPCVYMTF